MSNRTTRRAVGFLLLPSCAGILLPGAIHAQDPAPVPANEHAQQQPPSSPAAPPLQLSDLHVPEGFVVERVAAAPLVEHPMMAGFDERGRLFVAENAGVNVEFKELVKDPPSKVLMLEDADGDGTFDKRTVFADKMTFPSGALWHRGALYVCSPPGLWKLEDVDGDGVAEKRTEIVTGFGSIGNAADLHGPYLGPEGWLYFCDGRNGHDLTLGDGTRWAGRAAALYRCRTDGSGLEVVFAGGFDNPVEVAFTPEGEPLVNVNLLHAQPHRIDAILYGIEGGNYPYEPAWQEYTRTGDFLPSVGDLGWVATSGFMRYRGNSLGPKYAGRYFSTQFNTHKVVSHVVARDGAGFRVTHEDFLTCDHPDFHPVDVLEDADGSLLMVDTGGWFRIACPQSQVAKPEVKGAIYRIRRADAPRLADPRGSSLRWDGVNTRELVRRLSDVRPAVVGRATEALSRQPADDLQTGDAFRWARERPSVEAVWALMQMGPPASSILHEALQNGLNPPERRVAILRANGLTLTDEPRDGRPFIALLNSGDLEVAREAAIVLGRLRERRAVAPLMRALVGVGDPFLQHAIIYALIRIADRDATLAGLTDESPSVRRAALVALDQMPGGNLTAELVAPLLASGDAALRQSALSIATRRGEWAGQMVAPVRSALAKPAPDERERESLRAALVAFAKSDPMQALVAEVLGADSATPEARLLVLQAVTDAAATPLPGAWVEPLRRALTGGDAAVVVAAVNAVRAARADQFQDELARLAGDAARPAELRVAALGTMLPRATTVRAADFRLLLGELAAERPPLARLAAAQVLGTAPLKDDQLAELAGTLGDAGPLELPALLAAFERSASPAVGRALVASLGASKALTSLTPATLTQALAEYPPDVRRAGEALLARINPDAEAQRARLAELEPLLSGGDPSRGQSVFFGRTAACATCHAVRGTGAAVGPDLTKIASIRAGRDLLESLVFPSASFARGYEPFVVQTTAGQVHAGTLAGDSGDAIVLRTPAEVRVPRTSVKSIRQDRVSIMPQGLDEQLSRQELADLLAFLQSLK